MLVWIAWDGSSERELMHMALEPCMASTRVLACLVTKKCHFRTFKARTLQDDCADSGASTCTTEERFKSRPGPGAGISRCATKVGNRVETLSGASSENGGGSSREGAKSISRSALVVGLVLPPTWQIS